MTQATTPRDVPIVLTAAHGLTLLPGAKTVDPLPFLKVRKTRKYMGTQDDMAVVCVGRALADARLTLSAESGVAPDRVGLYAAVGFIPFERADIAPVLAGSLTRGAFDVRRFSEEGYTKAHPLLTFRCLPNMPAYHVSANFGITGPYMVTYPGEGQAFLALEEAQAALMDGTIDVAVVFATAHQRNFLVEHHYARLDHPVDAEHLRDAACALVLEREESARARGITARARLTALSVSYQATDPLENEPIANHTSSTSCGAPAPFIELVEQLSSLPLSQEWSTRDGLHARATWSRVEVA